MRQITIPTLWIVLGALAGACEKDAERSSGNAASAPPNVVSVTATEYVFEAPDSVAAGWIAFRMANQGNDVHYGHIVQLEPGRTIPEMVDAYAVAIRTSGPRPKWVRRFGGPGGTAPGGFSSVTQYLEAGSYVWICPVEDSAGHPHFAKGEFKPFVVYPSGSDVGRQAGTPKADVVVRLADYAFATDPPFRSGRQMIRVENTGVQPHDLVLMKLVPGKTVEDVRTGMNPERPRRSGLPADPPPPLDSLGTLMGGIAAIGSGIEAFFEADLTPGEYVLICMTTAPDGRSHIEHGMIQQISVR
jgi:hypothetical protein